MPGSKNLNSIFCFGKKENIFFQRTFRRFSTRNFRFLRSSNDESTSAESFWRFSPTRNRIFRYESIWSFVFGAEQRRSDDELDRHQSFTSIHRPFHSTRFETNFFIEKSQDERFDFLLSVGTVVMMFLLSPHLTIACLIGAPLILLVGKFVGNAHRRISEKIQSFTTDSLAIAQETIENIRTVRTFANQKHEFQRFQTLLEKSQKITFIQAVLTSAQRWFVDVRFSSSFRSFSHVQSRTTNTKFEQKPTFEDFAVR